MSELIFISGRFRSGTSMLWNVFNRLPQYCSYYEPLHTNLLSHIKHVQPKKDHIGIDEYWLSYTHLNNLNNYYSTDFGQKRLYMEKHDKWKELELYIRFLISSAGNKIPVFQFNRMDLRLSWLKNTFPESTIIHISRDAYPLWVSSRKHLNDEEKDNESHPDAYDVMQWCADLSPKFPMLQRKKSRSSYFRHYFIWKLSNLLANSHADIQLSLENHFFNTTTGVDILTQRFKWNEDQSSIIQKIIQKPESIHKPLIKENYINEIEESTNKIFKQLGLTKLFPSSPLDEIKLEFKKQWKHYSFDHEIVSQELLDALRFQKDELTALVN